MARLPASISLPFANGMLKRVPTMKDKNNVEKYYWRTS
jgi:hypothetical protein